MLEVKRVYTPYWEWEDWINGMYGDLLIDQDELLRFMSDLNKFGSAMQEVSNEWPRAMLNSLTNKSINRVAFLGQCGCCYKILATSKQTKSAWKLLTNDTLTKANIIAQQIIDRWTIQHMQELENTKKLGKNDATKVGYQMKLHLK